MARSFWQQLPRPFFALAPMEDVTDIAFREMFARHSKHIDIGCRYPLVLWTEFTPSDGLAFGDAHAQEKLRAKLSYTEAQRPIVAQIYNSNEERLQQAAALVQALGFDGVDINMGCPVQAVVKQVSGAALIQHPDLAVRLMRAVHAGAPNLPLSVKTRIGYSSVREMESWLSTLLMEHPSALTVHLRTRSEMSKVPAHWELMPRIVALRDSISPETVLIGNGDVQSVEEGRVLAEQYGCEGVMVGRAAFGVPDFFCDQRVSAREKIPFLLEHLALFDELLYRPGHKGYHVMKKHFKAYVSGWHGAKALREHLMATESPAEALALLQSAQEHV